MVRLLLRNRLPPLHEQVPTSTTSSHRSTEPRDAHFDSFLISFPIKLAFVECFTNKHLHGVGSNWFLIGLAVRHILVLSLTDFHPHPKRLAIARSDADSHRHIVG